MHEPLTILYEDRHCLAVAKPAALVMQAPERADGSPTLEALLREYLAVRHDKAGTTYLGMPHRLDRPATGVVLFAKTSKAAQRLAEQFRERAVRKIYWAVVAGAVEPAEGVWEDRLQKLPGEPRVVVDEAGKYARLTYRRLCVLPHGTWLEIELDTGRTHQIRVQAATRGWPILGDAWYGATARFAEGAIALHARSLTFLHPIRFEPLTVVAPLPKSWGQFAAQSVP